MRAPLVGISVSPAPGEAYYIPVGHQPALGQPEQLPLSTVLAHLGPLLEDESLPKTAHNGKFDMVVLANHGGNVHGLAFDTMIAAYLLGEGGSAAGASPVGRRLAQPEVARLQAPGHRDDADNRPHRQGGREAACR